MSETKHSELPWRHEGGFQVWTEDGYIVAHCDRPKDAILIVRAANAHDKLVAALTALELQALQSPDLNNPANEWGMEALALTRTVLATLESEQ
jgi:hypothetical protein